MRTTTGGSRRLGALAALLIVGAMAGPVASASAPPLSAEATLRLRALELNRLTGTAPMLAQLNALAEDPAGTRRLLAVARKMAASKPMPFTRNALRVLAQAAAELKEVETSIAFYRDSIAVERALKSEHGVASAYRSMLGVYAQAGKHSEVEKLYKEFEGLEGEEDGAIERYKPQMFNQMVLLLARGGAVDRAIKAVDERIRAVPRNWLLRTLRARAYHEGDRLEEAAKAYLEAMDRIRKDTRLDRDEQDDFIDECRYQLADVYIDLGQIDRAAEQLKILLARDPNNPSYHNTLGYIWADQGKNLAEAEKLIRKALELDRRQRRKANPVLKPEVDRDNAAYLDSLGWVLFKQGKAKEAKVYLIEAVKDREGQNIEIYDHLGDVHLALGEKSEALAAWKKGLEHVSPTSKRDQKRKTEVQKKIERLSKLTQD